MLKIEEDKFYRTRDGQKLGPAKLAGGDKWELPGRHACMHTTDGKYLEYPDESESALDLVAEWTEGPVRTVTRKEIVPGVYGRVIVDDAHGATVELRLSGDVWQADDLCAAATTLTEIADALDASRSTRIAAKMVGA